MILAEEKQLLERALAGDQASFGLFISPYLASVYNTSFLFVKNIQDAEDLTQDVFLRVWKQLKKFDQTKPFHPWLLTITKHVALDFLKKKKAIPLSDVGDTDIQEYFLNQLLDTHPNPAQIAEQQEIENTLHTHLKKLSLKNRTVVLLHHLKEWTFQEIASHLNEPLHTVKSRHRRAMIALKKNISKTE